MPSLVLRLGIHDYRKMAEYDANPRTECSIVNKFGKYVDLKEKPSTEHELHRKIYFSSNGIKLNLRTKIEINKQIILII